MLHERYRNDDGLHYRPQLNPEFRRRAIENNKRRAAQAEALRIAQEQKRQREEAREAAKDALAEITEPTKPPRTEFEKILYRVCAVFGVTVTDIKSHRRSADLAFARHAICYWACRRTAMSLPLIGRLLGNRDHSSIHHGRNIYPQKRAKMGRTLRKLR